MASVLLGPAVAIALATPTSGEAMALEEEAAERMDGQRKRSTFDLKT
jgi:hypothetical protein